MPSSYDELVTRRKPSRPGRTKASAHGPVLGGGPDQGTHGPSQRPVAWASGVAKHGPAARAALTDYVDLCLKKRPFPDYVIVNPQADRSRIGAISRRNSSPRSSMKTHGPDDTWRECLRHLARSMANEGAGLRILQTLRPGEECTSLPGALPMN